MTNKKALLHLWKSVDKTSIYQLSYIRNLAYELGEKELYFKFKDMKSDKIEELVQMIETQNELIDVLYSQMVDLTMMSKIELGDDVIKKINELQSKLKPKLKK